MSPWSPKPQLDPKLWFRNIHRGLTDEWHRPLKAVLPLMFSIFRRIETCPVHVCLGWGGSGKAMGCLCPKSSPSSTEGPTPKPFLFEVEAVGRGCVHNNHRVQSTTWTMKGWGGRRETHSPVVSGTKVALEDSAFARKQGLGPSLHEHVGLWT